MKIKVDGWEYEVDIEEVNGNIKVKYGGEEHLVEIKDEMEKPPVIKKKVIDISKDHYILQTGRTPACDFLKKISIAPISGTVCNIYVKEGDEVKCGDVLVSLIAMKMENKIMADCNGKVKEIKVNINDNVETGKILIVLE